MNLSRSGGYQPRAYRRLVHAEGLVKFGVTVRQSDLAIWARRELRAEAAAALQAVRAELEGYIRRQPEFRDSLLPVDPLPDAPRVIVAMCRAGKAAGVGPMAGVAGAVAQVVAEALAPYSPEVVVENGGDVYLLTQTQRRVVVVAPGSKLSGRLAMLVPAGEKLSVCTSSGRHGPSLSLGRADAAVVVSPDGALADAVATALGNRVRGRSDIKAALEWAAAIDNVVHAMVLCGSQFGAVGNLEIVPVSIDNNG